MLLTTGYEFQGYYITEYLDVIFDEILVGLGLGKSIASSFDNFFSSISGGEASTMVNRLNEVKQMLRKRVIEKAEALGANGLIGIDFESSKLGDLMMVSMTGTAVKIVRIVDPLPVTEADAVRRQTLSDLKVRRLNALVEELYRKNVLEYNEELNEDYRRVKTERDAAETAMRALNAVFLEKKAALEQQRAEAEAVKARIAEARSTIEKLKRYGSQRNVEPQIAEKNAEILQAETELARLAEVSEPLRQEVRTARDAAAEKREEYRVLETRLQEFLERNKL